MSSSSRFKDFASSAALVALALLAGCSQKPIEGPIIVVEPNEKLLHQIGHYSQADKALVASPGENGFLLYGPYADLLPGTYQVVFEVSVEGAHGSAGNVDVNAFTPAKPEGVLASSNLSSNGSDQKIALEFTTASGSKYEFRVRSDGNATIKLLKIVVKRH